MSEETIYVVVVGEPYSYGPPKKAFKKQWQAKEYVESLDLEGNYNDWWYDINEVPLVRGRR